MKRVRGADSVVKSSTATPNGSIAICTSVLIDRAAGISLVRAALGTEVIDEHPRAGVDAHYAARSWVANSSGATTRGVGVEPRKWSIAKRIRPSASKPCAGSLRRADRAYQVSGEYAMIVAAARVGSRRKARAEPVSALDCASPISCRGADRGAMRVTQFAFVTRSGARSGRRARRANRLPG